MSRALAVLILAACAFPAYAYLDPGTGSVILQSLIGIAAIGAAAVGAFFGRIKAFFFGTKETLKSPPTGDTVQRQ
jgi:hypothetical protein